MIKKLQKKKEEKGIGYVLEAFVAAIVLFIFAFSHHAEAPESQDWNSFQNQIGANDLTYVMQETGHTENMLRNGQTGSIKSVFSGITENRMSVSGTIKDTPIGESRVGYHTPSSDIYTEDLVEVANGDRCHGQLDEIDSEYPILRTQNSPDSLENHHGVRIYLSDEDPTHPAGQNGERDYDTFWVDNGTTCTFTTSEGYHSVDDYFLWGNKTDSNPETVYDLKSVDSEGQELTVYNASTPAKLKKELERPANTLNIETDFDSFSFPKENLNYDLIIFQSRDNLDSLNANADRILEYQETGSLLLLMNLQESDLETEFLNKTGLKWMNIGRSPDRNEIKFTDSVVSDKAREYFKSLRCIKCQPEIEPGGTISSSNGEHLTEGDKLLVGSNTLYQTEDWNSEENSMQGTDNVPEGLPHNCGEATRAQFEFPSEDGTEELTVYNTQLGSEDKCIDIRGVGIDLNNDEDLTDEGEAVHISDDQLKINERLYTVNIESQNEVNFTFDGDSRVEFTNYRREFPNHNINRFARMGNLAEDGLETQEAKVASAVILWLLEDDRNFGRQSTDSVETTAIGSIKENSYIPYKMFLRWSN